MKPALCLLSTCAFLCGCATTATPLSEATPLPLDRVLLKTAPKPHDTTVVVTRDSGLMDSGCYISLLINGKLAARFGTRETTTYFLAPEPTLFKIGRDPDGRGLCHLNQAVWHEQEFHLRPDATEYFRIEVYGGGPHIEPSG